MECTTTSLSKSEVDTVAGDRSLIYGIVIMTTFTDCLSSGLSIGPVRVAADSPGQVTHPSGECLFLNTTLGVPSVILSS